MADGLDFTRGAHPVILPADYVANSTISLVISLSVDGVSAGNIKIQRFAGATTPNGDTTIQTLLSSTDGQAAPTVANTTQSYTFAFTANPTAGDIIQMGLAFLRTDGVVDTNTNAIAFWGIWLSYTGDM